MLNRVNIKTKILVGVLLLGIASMGISGLQGYWQGRAALQETVFSNLTAIRSTKARQIEDYFDQIRNQVITYSENRTIVEAMRDFKASFKSVQRGVSRAVLRTMREPLEQYYQSDFLPHLEANRGTRENLATYFPSENATRLLQYHYIANNPNEVGNKDNLDRADDRSIYSRHHASYHPLIRSYLKKFGYYDIFLVDNETGHIVYSVFKEVDYATSLIDGPYAHTGVGKAFRAVQDAEEDQVVLIDFTGYAPSYDTPASFIASPVYDGDIQIGVLIFQVPVDAINRVMTSEHQWKEEGLGASGETYLVGNDYLMRSIARFLVEDPDGYYQALTRAGVERPTIDRIAKLESSTLTQSVRTEATRRALQGETGTAIITDYRGEFVLSAFQPLNIQGVDWGLLAEIDRTEAFASVAHLKQTLLWTSLLLLVLIGAAALFFTRTFTEPILKLFEASKKVANGNVDVTVDIQRSDELGSLAESFNQMVAHIRRAMEEVHEKGDIAAQAASDADAARNDAQAQQAYLAQSVSTMVQEMKRFAGGDLTIQLKAERDDEIGQLYEGFNHAVTNIADMMRRVEQAVASTANASAQISSSTEELATAVREQSAQAEEVAAAVEEMTRTIVDNASNATRTANVAQDNGKAARTGGKIVVQTVDKIREIAQVVGESAQMVEQLGTASEQIGEIVAVIDEIADQTNMLALNAAIEAARAGEQGRGFAVVADEVRKLAERTTKATQEIALMISTIQSETKEAVRTMKRGNSEVQTGIALADEAGTALNGIVTGASNTMEMISQIAAASEEQSATSAEIARSVESISTVSNRSANGISEIALSTEALNHLADDLRTLIGRFKLAPRDANSTNPLSSELTNREDEAQLPTWQEVSGRGEG